MTLKEHKLQLFKEWIRDDLRPKLLRKLQSCRAKKLQTFENKCRSFTKLVISRGEIETNKRGFWDMHIDHIIPVSYAKKYNLSPYLIGMSANLQLIPRDDNMKKGNTYLLLCE